MFQLLAKWVSTVREPDNIPEIGHKAFIDDDGFPMKPQRILSDLRKIMGDDFIVDVDIDSVSEATVTSMAAFWCRFFCPCGHFITRLTQLRKKGCPCSEMINCRGR